jgi:hypothetical protein
MLMRFIAQHVLTLILLRTTCLSMPLQHALYFALSVSYVLQHYNIARSMHVVFTLAQRCFRSSA